MNYFSVGIFLGLFGILTSCYHQSGKIRETGPEKVVERGHSIFLFYNVENLFDTIDNPETYDEEFTPEGGKKWTPYRYNDKLQKISRVLVSAGGWGLPELIGLAEIENRAVLEDLVNKTPLQKFNYTIVHKESPDFRGIDVALLYRSEVFEELNTRFIPVKFPFNPGGRTRDILYTKGIFKKKDTLHLFINHWPSRSGGQVKSEPKRLVTAGVLRALTDSLFVAERSPKIIITGDFNDEPTNKSLMEVLGSKNYDSAGKKTLANLMLDYSHGTYKYRSEWNKLDQFIISGSLKTGSPGSIRIGKEGLHVYNPEWLMVPDPRYPGQMPWRTYSGPRYNGGFSDHLPVFLQITEGKGNP